MGLNVFSSLGMNPWRRVANPIILHHSSLIHLACSVFFSIGDWWLPCRICSQPVSYNYNALWEPGEEATQRSLRPCPCPPRQLSAYHRPTCMWCVNSKLGWEGQSLSCNKYFLKRKFQAVVVSPSVYQMLFLHWGKNPSSAPWQTQTEHLHYLTPQCCVLLGSPALWRTRQPCSDCSLDAAQILPCVSSTNIIYHRCF